MQKKQKNKTFDKKIERRPNPFSKGQKNGMQTTKKVSFILLSAVFFAMSVALLRQGYRFLSFLSLAGAVTSLLYISPWSFSYMPAMLSIGISLTASFFEMLNFYVNNNTLNPA
jgi:hypothetical protein